MRAWLGQVPLRMSPSLGRGWVKPLPTPTCCVQNGQLHCTNPNWISPPGSYPGYPDCGGGAPAATPPPATTPPATTPPTSTAPTTTPSTGTNPGPGGGGASPVSTGPGGGGQQATTPPAAQPPPQTGWTQEQAIQNQAGLPAPMSQTYPAQPTGLPGGQPFSGPGAMGPMPVQNIAPPPAAPAAPAGAPPAPRAPSVPAAPPPPPCPPWSLPIVEWSKCVIRGHQ